MEDYMENGLGMLMVVACAVIIAPAFIWMAIGYRREIKKEKEILSQERA